MTKFYDLSDFSVKGNEITRGYINKIVQKPVAIIVELIVTSECNQSSETRTQGEEYLPSKLKTKMLVKGIDYF